MSSDSFEMVGVLLQSYPLLSSLSPSPPLWQCVLSRAACGFVCPALSGQTDPGLHVCCICRMPELNNNSGTHETPHSPLPSSRRQSQSSPALAGKTPSTFADNDAYALAIMMGLIETTTTRLDMHDLVPPPSPPPSATAAAAAASTCCLPASGLQANTRQASPATSASSRLSSCRFSFRKLQISRRGSRRIRRVPCDISRKLCFYPRPRPPYPDHCPFLPLLNPELPT